ncbi:hypothetical protein B0H13DRAFT_2317259 [Mycena leptocephala]|nr:hypothetical protein B0H13DRAFT_2317259 [Mycena leptocephala]
MNAPPAHKLPLNDNSSAHRMVIAARSPTAAPEEIVKNWNDSLATADGVRAVDADNEAKNKEQLDKIVEWVEFITGQERVNRNGIRSVADYFVFGVFFQIVVQPVIIVW